MKLKTLKDYLNSDVPFYNYDNENFLDFLEDVGFEFNIPFIHVTGTAGKTAICKLLKNIYEANSYKVDSIISEEFLNYKDLNLEKYPGFAAIFEKNWKIINKYELTIYEVLVFLKLYTFNEQKLDLAIIETYMGGALDSSNISAKPELIIINNAGLEHCDVLGKSVSEITLSKCGIIKDDCLVLLNAFDADIEYVLNEECRRTKSKLVKVNEFYNYDLKDFATLEVQYHPFPKFSVNTSALYNRENVACALEAINLLKNKYPVTDKLVQEGLSKEIGEGYSKVVSYQGKRIILDQANNPYSFEKLCKSLIFSLGDGYEKSAILFAVDYDKNLEKMLSIISRLSNDVVLTTFEDENARDEDGFFLFLADYSYIDDYKEALNTLLNKEEVENIIVTGNEKFVSIVNSYLKGE